MRAITGLVAILFLLLPGAWNARSVYAASCSDCHELGDGGAAAKSIHPPYGDGECGSCHLDHGETPGLLLTGEGNALCRECHDTSVPGFAKAHNDFNGSGASCTGCHDPHHSPLESLLRPDRHRPVVDGKCKSCHRKGGELLLPKVRLLCMSCHPRESFAGVSVHEPVRKGECLKCHDPHGSPERALLRGRYSENRWLEKGDRDYALCIQCHEDASFSGDLLESETGFRKGRKNLHRTHVKGESAAPGEERQSSMINCRNCHYAHASQNEHLVRSELDCGGVLCLKLSYRSLPGGGECGSGCHGIRAYGGKGEVGALPSPDDTSVRLPVDSSGMKSPEASSTTCSSCHDTGDSRFSRGTVHLPVKTGDCTACHVDHGPDNRLLLVSQEGELCSRCHDLERSSSVSAHRGFPLEGAACSDCHNPHSAENANLLRGREHEPFSERDCGACHGDPSAGWAVEDVDDLCLGCHDDISSEPLVHGALSRGPCTGCHSPHASDNDRILRKKVPDLCYQCHPPEEFKRETVHEPVRKGDCLVCHLPHGGQAAGLFRYPYPLERFVPFSEGAYALCLQCHDSSGLTGPEEASSTGFSSRGRNLHALHVRDRRAEVAGEERHFDGVACRNCHSPHSSDAPKLIRRTLDCGGVPCLDLEFRKMGVFGSCLKGCHGGQSYTP